MKCTSYNFIQSHLIFIHSRLVYILTWNFIFICSLFLCSSFNFFSLWYFLSLFNCLIRKMRTNISLSVVHNNIFPLITKKISCCLILNNNWIHIKLKLRGNFQGNILSPSHFLPTPVISHISQEISLSGALNPFRN